jgi:hypothetical protein
MAEKSNTIPQYCILRDEYYPISTLPCEMLTVLDSPIDESQAIKPDPLHLRRQLCRLPCPFEANPLSDTRHNMFR